jgi:hypothetical protein
MTTVYGIQHDDVAGNIFASDGHIHLCGGGLVVRVDEQVYHQRMGQWLADRMVRPLVWCGVDGTRCVMLPPVEGNGDVRVRLDRPNCVESPHVRTVHHQDVAATHRGRDGGGVR